jgi:hypothetical protein
VLLRPCLVATAEGTGTVRRLAIVSSKEIQESGLSDLLTVRLGELPGLELVERDLLDKVVQEIALSAMLGAEQPENRRKVGALLNADILVLLSTEEIEKRDNVRFVVCDCTTGARLRSGLVAFQSTDLQKASQGLVHVVRATLQQFEIGVRQIIGVSYFVSRNLVYDYDHLQVAYANLLANALSTVSGVAAIEIEEARSLRLEEELAGDVELERMVPLFVEGEFRVKVAGSETVRTTVRISDRGGTLKQIESPDLPMQMVGEFLTEDVSHEIVSLSEAPVPKMLDKQKQFEMLVSRASEFASVGAWKQSAGLREAAVLLKPDSIEQRRKLVDAYCRFNKARFGLEHLEYMIYNRLINMEQAIELSEKCLSSLPEVPLFHVPSPDMPVEAELLKNEFLRNVYPQILKLSPAAGRPTWHKSLVRQALHRRDVGGLMVGEYHDKEDLDLLLHLHMNVVPPEMSPLSEFIGFLKKHVQPGWRKSKWARGKPGYFTEEQFLDFLEAMSRSEKLLPSYYGRFARYALLHNEYSRRKKQRQGMEDLRGCVEALLTEMKNDEYRGKFRRQTQSLLEAIDRFVEVEEDPAEAGRNQRSHK